MQRKQNIVPSFILTQFDTGKIQQESLMEMHFWCSLNSSKGIAKEMKA